MSQPDEHELHERALAEEDEDRALALWIELAARGNPDAPDELRRVARSPDRARRGLAYETLMDLGLSHDDPMP